MDAAVLQFIAVAVMVISGMLATEIGGWRDDGDDDGWGF